MDIEHFTPKGICTGQGLYLNVPTPKTTVTINNITVMNTKSNYRGNFEIIIRDFNQNPNEFTLSNSKILNRAAKSGRKICFVFERHRAERFHKTSKTVVTFNNTAFKGNNTFRSGGALQLQTEDFQVHSNVIFVDCIFKKNYTKIGGPITIQALRVESYTPAHNCQCCEQ